MFRKLILGLIFAVGLVTLGALLFAKFPFERRIIKACFNNVGGLRAGAPVRIAGVDVGTIRKVRANTQREYCPAEVEMNLATTDDIEIPRDALGEISQGGFLGESFLSIDISQAIGPPIEQYGYLKTKPTTTLEEEIRAFQMFLKAAAAAQTVDREVQKEEASPPRASSRRKKKP